MKFVSEDILAYCHDHSNEDSELLKELIEYTFSTEDVPQMISGSHVGNFLQSLIKISKAKQAKSKLIEMAESTNISVLKKTSIDEFMKVMPSSGGKIISSE